MNNFFQIFIPVEQIHCETEDRDYLIGATPMPPKVATQVSTIPCCPVLHKCFTVHKKLGITEVTISQIGTLPPNCILYGFFFRFLTDFGGS